MPAANSVSWKIVKDSFSGKEIGALCIIDGNVAGVASFYADKDANQDGKVSSKEWISAFVFPVGLDGRAAAYVATQAYADPDLLIEHPELYNVRGDLIASFGGRMVIDGIYAVYFKRPVSSLGSGIAARITSDTVKAFAIRKGFEATIKKAFNAAASPR